MSITEILDRLEDFAAKGPGHYFAVEAGLWTLALLCIASGLWALARILFCV